MVLFTQRPLTAQWAEREEKLAERNLWIIELNSTLKGFSVSRSHKTNRGSIQNSTLEAREALSKQTKSAAPTGYVLKLKVDYEVRNETSFHIIIASKFLAAMLQKQRENEKKFYHF